MSEDTLVETTSRVHITIKPPTAKVVDPPPTEQQQPQAQPLQQPTPPAPTVVDPIRLPTDEVQTDDPEYALSQSIIKNLAKEIAAARKRLRAQKV